MLLCFMFPSIIFFILLVFVISLLFLVVLLLNYWFTLQYCHTRALKLIELLVLYSKTGLWLKLNLVWKSMAPSLACWCSVASCLYYCGWYIKDKISIWSIQIIRCSINLHSQNVYPHPPTKYRAQLIIDILDICFYIYFGPFVYLRGLNWGMNYKFYQNSLKLF